jgi:hypothetical protein
MTLTPETLDDIDRLSKRLLSTGWRAWDAQDVGVAVNALPDLVAAARERDALRAQIATLDPGAFEAFARATLEGRHE